MPVLTLHPALHLGSVVAQFPDRCSVDIGGEIAILNAEKGLYFGLNAIGGRIWELLGKPQQIQDLCDTICAEYEVSAEQCEQDVVVLLEKLHRSGLLKICEEVDA